MKKFFLPVFILITLLSGCTTVELDDDEDKVVEPVVVTHTVSFSTDGGTVIDSLSVVENEAIVLPENPTKEGYAFGGWFTDEKITIEYQGIDSIMEDVVLYAEWNPIRTMVSVNLEDDVLGTFSVYYGVTSDLAVLSYDHYTFLGWYRDPEYKIEITTLTGTLANQTIYIKIEPKEVTIPTEGIIDLTELPYYSYLSERNPVATITVKDVGVMTLELFPDVAKNTVDNFITYIQAEAFTSSTFHRVIENFMIQGGIVTNRNCPISGDFTSNGFDNDLQHYRGVLSMARTSDPDSGTSQFFVMHADSHFLDGEYASFGGLTSGFNILDYIATIDTLNTDEPLVSVVIESITIDLNGYEVGTVVCAD